MKLLALIVILILAGVAYARYRFSCAEKACQEKLKQLRIVFKEREISIRAYLDYVNTYQVREKELIGHVYEMLEYPKRHDNPMVEISLESAAGIIMKGLCIKMDAYPYIYEKQEYQRVRSNLLAAMSIVLMHAKVYNTEAQQYNRMLEQFGYNFVAEACHLERMPEYESEEELVRNYKVAF